MRIWKKEMSLEQLNTMGKGNLLDYLGFEFTAIGEDYLEMSMPVDHRTKQVAGLLHGGASVALAESAGSIASWLCMESMSAQAVGVEINANHLKSARDGKAIACVRPLRLGRTLHVWDIRIRNEQDELLCVSRLTVSVKPG